jgi:hypothetical protein
MERRQFLKLAVGFAAGATALARLHKLLRCFRSRQLKIRRMPIQP